MKKAFTLIELLVVVAIISLLVSILMPSLAKAKLLAKRAACSAGLHTVGLGAQMYSADFSEEVPVCTSNIKDATNNYLSWRTNLLPYVRAYQLFNCPAAVDAPLTPKGEPVFHSDDELTSTEIGAGTANCGSYGVMAVFAVSQYLLPDCFGGQSNAFPTSCNSFSLVPGRAWMNPNDSVYCADACYVSRPDRGTSYIMPPTPDLLAPASFSYLPRCFADRHVGTNCLFLDGRVQNYPIQTLQNMNNGASDCIWDVY